MMVTDEAIWHTHPDVVTIYFHEAILRSGYEV